MKVRQTRWLAAGLIVGPVMERRETCSLDATAARPKRMHQIEPFTNRDKAP